MTRRPLVLALFAVCCSHPLTALDAPAPVPAAPAASAPAVTLAADPAKQAAIEAAKNKLKEAESKIKGIRRETDKDPAIAELIQKSDAAKSAYETALKADENWKKAKDAEDAASKIYNAKLDLKMAADPECAAASAALAAAAKAVEEARANIEKAKAAKDDAKKAEAETQVKSAELKQSEVNASQRNILKAGKRRVEQACEAELAVDAKAMKDARAARVQTEAVPALQQLNDARKAADKAFNEARDAKLKQNPAFIEADKDVTKAKDELGALLK